MSYVPTGIDAFRFLEGKTTKMVSNTADTSSLAPTKETPFLPPDGQREEKAKIPKMLLWGGALLAGGIVLWGVLK